LKTVKEAIECFTDKLSSTSDTPRLDTELLIATVTSQSRTQLFAHSERELTSAENKQLEKYIKRRQAGEPIAYLIGYKEFWSLGFQVTSDVLIPRPDTEILIEWALQNLPENETCRIADLGTGSGAIAITLAYERINWIIDAVDNSKRALKIAQKNAQRHHVKNVNFHNGEWCKPLPYKHYHAVLANPPYISSDDSHLQQLKYEPQSALNGGEDGLDAIRVIAKEAKQYLAESGWLVVEHGYDQSERIVALMKEHGYCGVKDHLDLGGRPRMVVGRRC